MYHCVCPTDSFVKNKLDRVLAQQWFDDNCKPNYTWYRHNNASVGYEVVNNTVHGVYLTDNPMAFHSNQWGDISLPEHVDIIIHIAVMAFHKKEAFEYMSGIKK